MLSVNSISVNRAVLASLRQTNADLATAQNHIASGLKVASAADNASVWNTAQTIRKDIAAQDGVDGSIAIAKGQADAANAGLTSIADLLQKIKSAAANLADATSGSPVANNLVIQKQIKTYVDQILTVAKGATFQGKNLLTGTDASTVTPVIGYDNGSQVTGLFTITNMMDTSGSGGKLGTVYGYGGAASWNTSLTASTVTNAIDTAITDVNNYITSVTSYANSLTSQQDFYDKLKDIRSTALSALVDADMTEESARVQALQVKQQLAYQALSVGNSSAQNILRLFQ